VFLLRSTSRPDGLSAVAAPFAPLMLTKRGMEIDYEAKTVSAHFS
jgi:hypothetical protein